MRRRQRKSEARLERVHRQHHYVEGERPEPNAIVDCGWGRLLFANTFDDVDHLVSEIRAEGPEQRDIAIYASDPHVLNVTPPANLFPEPPHPYLPHPPTNRRRPPHPPGFFNPRLTATPHTPT